MNHKQSLVYIIIYTCNHHTIRHVLKYNNEQSLVCIIIYLQTNTQYNYNSIYNPGVHLTLVT